MRPPVRLRTDYLILSVCFLLGVAAGHFAGGLVSDEQHRELSAYLSVYAQGASAGQGTSLAGVLFAYFRMPVALFLMGLAACGVWTVPLCLAGQGFFLAFSVHAFVGALGRGGILFAFAAFGIRCLFVLPCCFFLAARSWAAAGKLRRREHLRRREDDGRAAVYPVVLCGVLLLVGCVMEISLVPRLFLGILEHISP